MNTLVVFAALIAVAFCKINNDNPSPTPRAINCPNKLCHGKADGNHKVDYEPNHFLQCVGGNAYCQACWPSNLVYSEKCNQCLYSAEDECVTTQKWEPATTFECPDQCPHEGHDFSGNIVDKSNPRQYVACWEGVTVGCIACPGNLKFNQKENACLYDGKYFTEPTRQ